MNFTAHHVTVNTIVCLIISALTALGQTQESTDVQKLPPDQTIEREMSRKEIHRYKFDLKGNEFSQVRVERKGVKVFLQLLDPWLSPLPFAPTQQPQAPLTNQSRIEAAKQAFDQANQLYKEGSAESLMKAVEKFDEARFLYKALADHRGEGTALNRIGKIYNDLGERRKAIDYYNQALTLARAVGDHGLEAPTLGNIGLTYQRLGERQRALDHFRQALTLAREVNDRFGEAVTLNNIGLVYSALGERQTALNYYNQALPLRLGLDDRHGEAVTLLNIGAVYDDLGENQKALDYCNRALPLLRETGDRSAEAETLNRVGMIYDHLGERQKALNSYDRALLLRRVVGDRNGEAATLSNIGSVYHILGEGQKALHYYDQALTLTRMSDRAAEASVLSNIGAVYDVLGEKRKARNYYFHALRLSRAVGDPDGEATTLSNLMESWKDNNTPLAISYGKQAVNSFQKLRANISGLDKALQRTFVNSKEATYRDLAALLISTGRLSEARQVLGLLKEEEYFEFVRRDAEAASLTAVQITFSPAEAELEKRFSEISNRLGSISAQRSALLALKQRTVKQDQALAELEGQLEIANQGFQKFLDQLEAELKAQPNTNNVVALRDAQALQSSLRELNAVALYTIVGPGSYRVILITPDVEKAYEYKISEGDLNKKVFAFREALQKPAANPLPLAQEFYRILIGPELARDIAHTKKQTIVWSLDGALRYLPMAALHDGHKYLVESYRNVVMTLASRDHLNDPVSRKWQALGLGVSKGETINVEGHGPIDFRPLSSREELAGIVRDPATSSRTGILPGKVILDEKFTAEAMKTALRLQAEQQPYKLVHIASHFNFEPGDETKSFLLLGGGKTLTLAQLKSMSQIFDRVELLTLSACDTATGGERQGKEVEGFAVLAQRQGAHAIIASLWPVYDPSTSQLMQTFYRLRDEHPGMSKAEAMRQTQLTMLHPEGDPKAPFAHPYFWAPFILIGNWR